MEGGCLFYSWLCLLLLHVSIGCVSHSFQNVPFFYHSFWPCRYGFLTFPVGDKFFWSDQGCHFPDHMKFPDFSRPRLSSTVILRPFRGVWGHAPPENFQN